MALVVREHGHKPPNLILKVGKNPSHILMGRCGSAISILTCKKNQKSETKPFWSVRRYAYRPERTMNDPWSAYVLVRQQENELFVFQKQRGGDFGCGHQALDHRRGKSLMLHPVQSGNGTAARRGHLVDFRFRMNMRLQQERGRPAGGLGRHPERFLGMKTDLDTALRGGAYRAQEKSDTAGAERRRGNHILLGNNQRFAQLVKQLDCRLKRPAVLIIGGQTGHRFADRDSGIGHDANNGNIPPQLPVDLGGGHAGHGRQYQMSARQD